MAFTDSQTILVEDPAVTVPAEKVLLAALASFKPVACMFCKDAQGNPKLIEPRLDEMDCGSVGKVPAAVWECGVEVAGPHYRRTAPIKLGAEVDGGNTSASISVGVGVEVQIK